MSSSLRNNNRLVAPVPRFWDREVQPSRGSNFNDCETRQATIEVRFAVWFGIRSPETGLAPGFWIPVESPPFWLDVMVASSFRPIESS